MVIYKDCTVHVVLLRSQHSGRRVGLFRIRSLPLPGVYGPYFTYSSTLPYFLEEPRSANLQLLGRPRTLSKYFSAREGARVWKFWPSLFEYCLLYSCKTADCFRILSFIFLQKLRIVLHKLCHSLSSTNDDSVISVWRSVRLRLSKE